ncbi:PAS domain S-box protein [Nocardioides albidus]|uniref:histidine kinase n=1 Tax=Nocardioides albidus TaxID=1517589 RepID=A0A5C4VQE4_9ACTN|nr:ATP-binding protein [Nocardioides albidus]TNM37489.1 PAS domain S-box protein [Nocardioides albidus]
MQLDPRAPELVSEDFVAMVNATRLCILIHDAGTKNILWANPAACRLLEFSVSELRPLKANHMSSSAQQYDRVIGRAWLQEAVERGTSRIEWHYRSKSGRVIPTDAIAIRVDLMQGPAVMVQFRDIEKEQQIERELRIATSYVDALARHTKTVAFMLDGAGAIRFATDTALAHIGIDADDDQPVGRPLVAYGRLRIEGRAATWAEVAQRTAPVLAVQLEVHSNGDQPIWLEGSVERLSDQSANGPDTEEKVESYLMILHDVSARVRGEAARELDLRHENYLARYNAMGDMAMAIAHELGQPLSAAGNFLAGVLARARSLTASGQLPDLTATQLGYGVESAVTQIERASTIVSTLRAFVGHLEHVEQVVDLNDIVTECLYFIRLRAGDPGVEVEVRLSAEPVPVRCERVLTGQVVMNLCFNAIDEMAQCDPERRRIVLATARDLPGSGVFTVDDAGRGLRHDPFAVSFTSKAHGSGIGLALSHRIITRQHGRIWAERRDEGGSRFAFALPLVATPDDETST